MKDKIFDIQTIGLTTLLILIFGVNQGIGQNDSTLQGQPNIIYILLDDVGYSDLGSYGSEISTPNMDLLATTGLRYNFFETRAMCSPTRAALLTGRNNQSVGMSDLARGPFEDGPAHSRGYISNSAATVGQLLQNYGYRTTISGKWHLTPNEQYEHIDSEISVNQSNWPQNMGFHNFYGILSGWTDQFEPHKMGPGRRIIEGSKLSTGIEETEYHFSEEIVTRAIGYLKEGFAQDKTQPQFLYLAFGATHAPIQVPDEYIEKYKGVYDKGWDELRQSRFKRQKELGIIPENTILTERHPEDPEWNSLSEVEKKVHARYMQVYAGFLEHTDKQIGRLIDFLKHTGEYENTLIFLMSDNGAAPEGGVDGNFLSPYEDYTTVQEVYKRLDDLGSVRSSALYARPWARAGGVPFKRYKLWPYAGGVRAPLIISWPKVIKDGGGIRTQYVEAIDITPTVYDILDIDVPEYFNGKKQLNIHGQSIRQTFTDSDASTRSKQFFVMRDNRAIYYQGWKAIAIHEKGTSFEDDRWELYNVEEDFSEAIDLSKEYPEKLEELKNLWWSEAEKYDALPLIEFEWR